MHDTLPPASVSATHAVECGDRLRLAREKQALSVSQASAATRIPTRVLDALERGDWESLGAALYVRGPLRSYGKLLGIDVEPYVMDVAQVAPPQLVSHQRTPPFRHFSEAVAPKLVYVLMTAIIAVPVWMAATRSPVADSGDAVRTASLDVPTQVPASTSAHQAPATGQPQSLVVASMTPTMPAPAAAASNVLVLHFDGESWMQAFAADGSVVEKGLVRSGDSRTFAPGQVARLTLGNANEVRAERNGSQVDLGPYLRSNVARFAVSSDGSLAPVSE